MRIDDKGVGAIQPALQNVWIGFPRKGSAGDVLEMHISGGNPFHVGSQVFPGRELKNIDLYFPVLPKLMRLRRIINGELHTGILVYTFKKRLCSR